MVLVFGCLVIESVTFTSVLLPCVAVLTLRLSRKSHGPIVRSFFRLDFQFVAQNYWVKKEGENTREVSAEMLVSLGISRVWYRGTTDGFKAKGVGVGDEFLASASVFHDKKKYLYQCVVGMEFVYAKPSLFPILQGQ